MEVRREVGALILFQAPLGWVYGRLLVVARLLFLAIFSLRLEMGLEWNSGLISGERIILWACVFQNYSESIVLRRLMWLISCNSLMGFFIGTWSCCEQFRIGNWNLCLFFWMLYMESCWGELVRIGCVGFLLRVGALRWVVIIRLCWVYVFSPSLGEVFGNQRFLTESHFLFGLQFWELFWLLIIYVRGRWWFWIGVICAKVRESR